MFDACLQHSGPDGEGKFATRKDALKALAEWRARGTVKGNPEPFKCRVGNHWHNGRDRRFRWRSA